MNREPKRRPRIDPATLGRRIVNRRTDLGMEQGELAILAELSRAYVSRLENGLVANPKLFDIERIASVLDIPLPALVTPDDTQITRTHLSHEWDVFQEQVKDLPPEIAEQAIRAFRESVAVLHNASALARRN